MIYYFFVFLAVVTLALQFSATKLYQTKFGASIRASLSFTALCGISAALIFFCIGGFRLDFTPFSTFCAAGVALLCAGYTLVGFKVVSLGPMSVYTMFLMLGGMLLPYLYGMIFLEEAISIWRIIGILLLALSLALPCVSSLKRGVKPLYWLLCAVVFLMNGCVSILSKLHQIESFRETIGATAFVTLSNLFNGLFSLAALAVIVALSGGRRASGKSSAGQAPDKAPAARRLIPVIALAAAAFSGFSYMLQLIGAANLPASVLYPMITGGSVVLTALAARIFFRETPDRLTLVSLALSFCATFLFLF